MLEQEWRGGRERVFVEIENRAETPDVEFESHVQAEVSKGVRKKPSGAKVPRKTVIQTTQYERSAEVVAWVLIEANGVCEFCGGPVPFSTPVGIPFLEVHHIRRLADGGSDTFENAAALCPNCHRELYYRQNARIDLMT